MPETEMFSPESFHLFQNYPNPFNPSTSFHFELPINSQVKMTIYNLNGQEVAVIVDSFLNKGTYTVNWSAPDHLVSGIYIYKLEADQFSSMKQMMFIK